MKSIFAGVLLALISSLSLAQASSVTATAAIAWMAPTMDSNGNPLTSNPQNTLTGYNVYVSTSPLTVVPATPTTTVTASSSGTATTATASVTATVGQTLYVYITAVNAAGQSKLSIPATYTVIAPNAPPGVPTSVVITVTIT